MSKLGWYCESCGLHHIFVTCCDVIPFADWSAMSQDERAEAYIRAMGESLSRQLSAR